MPVLWSISLLMLLAGAVGGLVNSLLVDNTLGVAKKGWSGWVLTLVTNTLLGAVAAWLSWALYGPFAGVSIVPPAKHLAVGLPLSALASAVVVGIGGARWLSNEVDKRILTRAASAARANEADPQKALGIATAPPLEALQLASGGSRQ